MNRIQKKSLRKVLNQVEADMKKRKKTRKLVKSMKKVGKIQNIDKALIISDTGDVWIEAGIGEDKNYREEFSSVATAEKWLKQNKFTKDKKQPNNPNMQTWSR